MYGRSSANQSDIEMQLVRTSANSFPQQISELDIDMRSKKGHFGWTLVGNDYLPHIFRGTEAFFLLEYLSR